MPTRVTSSTGGGTQIGGGTTTHTHASLSGLDADDHSQYVHTTTARTVSAAHEFTALKRATLTDADTTGASAGILLELTDYRTGAGRYAVDIKKEQLAVTPAVARSAFVIHYYQLGTTQEAAFVLDNITPATAMRIRNAYNASKTTPGPGTGTYITFDHNDGATTTTKAVVRSDGTYRSATGVEVWTNLDTDSVATTRLLTTGLWLGAGGASNPDVRLSRGSANRMDVASGDGFRIVGGDTAARDAVTPANGMLWYNTSTSKFQGYAGGAWVDLH